jgi:hypothetical protein
MKYAISLASVFFIKRQTLAGGSEIPITITDKFIGKEGLGQS